MRAIKIYQENASFLLPLLKEFAAYHQVGNFPEDAAEKIRHLFTSQSMHMAWVAVEGREPVGFNSASQTLSLFRLQPVIFVTGFYVSEKYRKTKAALMLLRALRLCGENFQGEKE